MDDCFIFWQFIGGCFHTACLGIIFTTFIENEHGVIMLDTKMITHFMNIIFSHDPFFDIVSPRHVINTEYSGSDKFLLCIFTRARHNNGIEFYRLLLIYFVCKI
ncbi:hypothetical protein BFG06_10410 [Aeromonas caviae]|nr:hypothetical protein BFG06_10410 [Aeromonas caviae]